MIATYQKYSLEFKQASGTSRGILKTKETWFIILDSNGRKGVGECGILRGLSIDDRVDYEATLQWTCRNIRLGFDLLREKLTAFPSIQMGLEMAFKALDAEQAFKLFPSEFTQGTAGIPINGLIWMGTEAFMKQQIQDKIEAGFSCIKLKIGAIDFQAELNLLKSIRQNFNPETIELRVDANGAFSPEEALEKLKYLSDFDLHSIEQPIKVMQPDAMASLCEKSPIAIALDEELIGLFTKEERAALLEKINPQYIILKPSFIGGFIGTDEWIDLAEKQAVGWWITSALESNIGLNAIAQYTFLKASKMPQGLGTGGLFSNNFKSPLEVKNATLRYNNAQAWDFNL